MGRRVGPSAAWPIAPGRDTPEAQAERSVTRERSLEQQIRERLTEVQAVVADHEPMRERALWLAGHLSEQTHEGSRDFYRWVAVVQKFFHWLVDDNFVFLGYEEFTERNLS